MVFEKTLGLLKNSEAIYYWGVAFLANLIIGTVRLVCSTVREPRNNLKSSHFKAVHTTTRMRLKWNPPTPILFFFNLIAPSVDHYWNLLLVLYIQITPADCQNQAQGPYTSFHKFSSDKWVQSTPETRIESQMICSPLQEIIWLYKII